MYLEIEPRNNNQAWQIFYDDGITTKGYFRAKQEQDKNRDAEYYQLSLGGVVEFLDKHAELTDDDEYKNSGKAIYHLLIDINLKNNQ